MKSKIFKLLTVFAILNLLKGRKEKTLNWSSLFSVMASLSLSKNFQFMTKSEQREIMSEIKPKLVKNNFLFNDLERVLRDINTKAKSGDYIGQNEVIKFLRTYFNDMTFLIRETFVDPARRAKVSSFTLTDSEALEVLRQVNPEFAKQL